MKKTILTLFALSLAAATPQLVHGWFGTWESPESSATSASEMQTYSAHDKDYDKLHQAADGMGPQPATAVPAK
jgi:hypothetical protein